MNNLQYSRIILDELNNTLSRISPDDTDRLVTALLEAEEIFTAGAGRSGLAAKGFAMRLMHLGRNSHVVGETCTPNITDKGLLVICSGSGATSSLADHAAKASQMGAEVALITINSDCPIARMADIVIEIPAVSPKRALQGAVKSIQPMGSLFEQSVNLYLDSIILILMEKLQMDSDTMFGRHANLE